MQLHQQYQEQHLQLQQQAQQQKASLEQQAMQLTMEYQQKKVSVIEFALTDIYSLIYRLCIYLTSLK